MTSRGPRRSAAHPAAAPPARVDTTPHTPPPPRARRPRTHLARRAGPPGAGRVSPRAAAAAAGPGPRFPGGGRGAAAGSGRGGGCRGPGGERGPSARPAKARPGPARGSSLPALPRVLGCPGPVSPGWASAWYADSPGGCPRGARLTQPAGCPQGARLVLLGPPLLRGVLGYGLGAPQALGCPSWVPPGCLANYATWPPAPQGAGPALQRAPPGCSRNPAGCPHAPRGCSANHSAHPPAPQGALVPQHRHSQGAGLPQPGGPGCSLGSGTHRHVSGHWKRASVSASWHTPMQGPCCGQGRLPRPPSRRGQGDPWLSPGQQDSHSRWPKPMLSSQDALGLNPCQEQGMGDTGHHPPSPPPQAQRAPWESWPPQCWGVQASKGSARETSYQRAGSALPGKRVGRNALLHARRARWDSPGMESGLQPLSCQASTQPWPAPGHSPCPLPSSRLGARHSALGRGRSWSSSSPRWPQGFCPHLLRALGGSHLIAFPAHVVISLAAGMG